jgi:hypothetical protein
MKQNGNMKTGNEKPIKWIDEEKITYQQSPQMSNPQTYDSSSECPRNRGQPGLTVCAILWEDSQEIHSCDENHILSVALAEHRCQDFHRFCFWKIFKNGHQTWLNCALGGC